MKEKFKFTHRTDGGLEYTATLHGNHYVVSWDKPQFNNDTMMTTYTIAEVQDHLDTGRWILIDEKKLLKDFYFKSKTAKDALFRATLVECFIGVKQKQYRVDWITQGGYPETQAYYPVEAVERFFRTEEWRLADDPTKPYDVDFTQEQLTDWAMKHFTSIEVGYEPLIPDIVEFVPLSRKRPQLPTKRVLKFEGEDFSFTLKGENDALLAALMTAVDAHLIA